MDICHHGFINGKCGQCAELGLDKVAPPAKPEKFTKEEVAVFGLGAPQMIRLIQSRITNVLGRMHGEFKAGKHDQLTALAEYSTLRDLEIEITNTLKVEAQRADRANGAN